MTPRGSLLHWLRELVRNMLHGRRRDAELRADVASYVALLTEENVAAGLSPEAARRAALLEFGGVDAVMEATRAVRAGALLAQCWQDTRYALRMVRRDASFSVVAILTLALGIGVNTAIFSVVNAVLLEPLPYSDPDRLVLVWERNASIGKDRDPVAPLNYQDWRAQNAVFEEVGAYRFRGYALSRAEDPEQLLALTLTASVFRVLRANAHVGRVFTEDEERRRDRVVVLSHHLWQRRFAGDRSVVGRGITLDEVPFTVVGIMPPQFEFPDGNPVDMYLPLLFSPNELNGRRSHSLNVIARLKEGATIEGAKDDIGSIAHRIAAADPTSNPDVSVAGAHDALVQDVRLGLMILFAAVGFVLLIACANVASLLLVRATSRRREIAMRATLGAGPGRLVRQLLTESVVLALIGGALGMVAARWLLGALVRFQPPDLPRVDQVEIDTTVLLFVTAAALATGLLFGIIPALQAVTTRLSEVSGSIKAGPPARSRARASLVVAEVAISLILLAGAGLMVRSLIKLQHLDLGFQPDNVLTAQILLANRKYPIDPGQYRAQQPDATPVLDARPSVFFSQLEERLKGVPGIDSVGAVSALPLNPVGADYDLPVVVAGKPRPRVGEEPQADFRIATAGYFRTMRIPLLRGREFNAFDGPNSPSVVVINETMARQMFPGEDPLGQRIVLYGRAREIIGVVGSVRHRGFSRAARPEMILPYRQFQTGAMTLAVRSSLDRTALVAAIAQAVHALDSQQPISRVRTMNEFVADAVAQPRFATILLGGFAALALVLALVGVYGVTSYGVRQRAREIAVRMALGAQRHEVVRLVARESLSCAALGLTFGVVGAAVGTRFMAGLLFEVTATDPLTFTMATVALGATAVAASYIPALRATRIAPATTLRAE